MILINWLIGLLLMIFGVLTMLDPSPNWYWDKFGFNIDLSSVKIPFGSALVLLGFLLFIQVFRKKKKLLTNVICPKCETPYLYNDLEDGVCPSCNVQTLDVRDYYELKDGASSKGEEKT